MNKNIETEILYGMQYNQQNSLKSYPQLSCKRACIKYITMIL